MIFQLIFILVYVFISGGILSTSAKDLCMSRGLHTGEHHCGRRYS